MKGNHGGGSAIPANATAFTHGNYQVDIDSRPHPASLSETGDCKLSPFCLPTFKIAETFSHQTNKVKIDYGTNSHQCSESTSRQFAVASQGETSDEIFRTIAASVCLSAAGRLVDVSSPGRLNLPLPRVQRLGDFHGSPSQ